MLKDLMPSIYELVDKDYEKIKTKETESIIVEMLKKCTPVLIPELRQVSGIPGAGKSTYCAKNLPSNFLFLSFDKIMQSIPSYQTTLKLYGPQIAFKEFEMKARIIGYEVLSRAIERHYNIMFEHSGTNNAHIELFKNISKFGYKTSVDFIMCEVNTAIKRVKDREKIINRHVPEALILERSNKLKNYVSEYKKITSNIKVLDGINNFSPLNKI